MKIAINSNLKNSIELHCLLESMKKHPEFNEYDVLVFIGGNFGEHDYIFEKSGNITYIKCNYNSIDYTALIALVELYRGNIDEHYFYIHDTCEVGDTFFSKLKSIDVSDVSSIKIYTKSMNIGIYSQTILNKFRDLLISKKQFNNNNIVEFKKECIATEDYIFNNDPKNTILDNYTGRIPWASPQNYYLNGTLRVTEYYENIDIYKFKANWGGQEGVVL